MKVANQAHVTFILCSGELVFVRHFTERISKQVADVFPRYAATLLANALFVSKA